MGKTVQGQNFFNVGGLAALRDEDPNRAQIISIRLEDYNIETIESFSRWVTAHAGRLRRKEPELAEKFVDIYRNIFQAVIRPEAGAEQAAFSTNERFLIESKGLITDVLNQVKDEDGAREVYLCCAYANECIDRFVSLLDQNNS